MTNSPTATAPLYGSSEPSLRHTAENVGTIGPDIRGHMRRWGLHADPWQCTVSDDMWRVRDKSLALAADEIGLLVSRQNGKGEVLLEFVLAHLFVLQSRVPKIILWTAHELKTAMEGFRRLRAVIESNPRLNARVEKIISANGKEAIHFKPQSKQVDVHGKPAKEGARVMFIARSKNSGRGFQADVIVCDEAQQMSQLAYDALTYTQDTRANPQMLFCGTAPAPEHDSEVFEGVRDRGRTTKASRTTWLEWSPVGSWDPDRAETIDVTSPDVWCQAVPSLGYRIPESRVRSSLVKAEGRLDAWSRERLSMWPCRRPEQEVARSRIDLEAWAATADPDASRGDPTALGTWLARAANYASIAAASRLADGRIFVEVLDTAEQVLWVPPALADARDDLDPVSIAVDPKNAMVLLPGLEAGGITPFKLTISELCASFQQFIELANSGQIVHAGGLDLTTSLKCAGTRAIGAYGEYWEQVDPEEPITQIAAVTVAVYALISAESKPKKNRVLQGVT